MSAAFSLDYSGDPVPCDFKGCILEAWHDGEHQFAPKKQIEWSYDRHCVVCGSSLHRSRRGQSHGLRHVWIRRVSAALCAALPVCRSNRVPLPTARLPARTRSAFPDPS